MDAQELKPEAAGTTGAPDPGRRLPRMRIGAAVAVAAGAGLGAWALVGHGGPASSSPSTVAASPPAAPAATAKPIGPVALSAGGLRTLSSSVDQPIYWAGPKAGYLYELTRTSEGRVFVRLPAAGRSGRARSGRSTWSWPTYPFQNPLQALKNLAGTARRENAGGGVAMVDAGHRWSAWSTHVGVQVGADPHRDDSAPVQCWPVDPRLCPRRLPDVDPDGAAAIRHPLLHARSSVPQPVFADAGSFTGPGNAPGCSRDGRSDRVL